MDLQRTRFRFLRIRWIRLAPSAVFLPYIPDHETPEEQYLSPPRMSAVLATPHILQNLSVPGIVVQQTREKASGKLPPYKSSLIKTRSVQSDGGPMCQIQRRPYQGCNIMLEADHNHIVPLQPRVMSACFAQVADHFRGYCY